MALNCKDRLHDIVKEEIEYFKDLESVEWTETMQRSFVKMDKEVEQPCCNDADTKCRCELQTPQCDAVGSTAVAAVVTSDKIIVSNCGDSRAVLCRDGVAIPLSSDHKVRFSSFISATRAVVLSLQLWRVKHHLYPMSFSCFLTGCFNYVQPDRPDELLRIQAAGGRVIYWDGARVLGVLAMSRAIGKMMRRI